jgi:hypothetical protein
MSHTCHGREIRSRPPEAQSLRPRTRRDSERPVLSWRVRHFLAYLDRIGRGGLGTVTADDVRGFMVEMAPKRPAGIGNLVWSLKRFFAFLNAAGLSLDPPIDVAGRRLDPDSIMVVVTDARDLRRGRRPLLTGGVGLSG